MRLLVCLTIALTLASTVAFAQSPPSPAEPVHDVSALAKTTQNPVGDLTSVPFQFNFNTGGDLEQETSLNLNFQPVIPFKLSADWNVILRPILPINSAPGRDGTRYSGAGDIQTQIFFTPAKPG